MVIRAYLKDWHNGNQVISGYSWVDLSNYLDTSAHVQLTDRIDDAFISGKCKLWLGLQDPIPPYTPFMVNGKCMVGKSTVTKYLTQTNLYVHDVDLLEASAFLNCLLLGVKVYSQESPTWEYDISKFAYIVELINTLYPDYHFTIKDSNTNPIAYLSQYINTRKTYLFDAKSTLFYALNQICLENNSKIRVTFSESNPSQFFIKLEKVPRETSYTIQASKIISNKGDQSAEDYGRYLDTYASNVVDRNTLTHCEFIEPRANDTARTADNAVIMLPTNIEKVEEFGVHQVYTIRFFIHGLQNYWAEEYLQNEFASGMTYDSISLMYFMVGSNKHYIFEELWDNYLSKYFPYRSKNYFYQNATTQPYDSTYNNLVIEIPYSCNGKFPIVGCEEMSEWTLRTPQNQTESLVYTTGSNQITNMNASYKNDIWNKFIGESRGNFLNYNNESPHTSYEVNGDDNPLDLYMYQELSNNDDIFHYQYWCDYYAITNPILRDEKEDANIAPISRTYGNSANFIDFDKIIPNMAISNATLGQIEKTVQLDLSNDSTLPLSGQPTTFEGRSWYISSVIWDYALNATFATLTLVKEYQKKAESIGVDSQSEFTNNPLRNITERSIMLMGTTTDSIESITSKVWYMRFSFYDMNGALIHNINGSDDYYRLYKRCSVQATNDTLLFYTEMLDQMILDYGLSNVVSTGYVEQFPYLYTDANAECKFVQVEIGTMSRTNARLPIDITTGKNVTFTRKRIWYNIRIDKDAREKLTFSIKIKKTN